MAPFHMCCRGSLSRCVSVLWRRSDRHMYRTSEMAPLAVDDFLQRDVFSMHFRGSRMPRAIRTTMQFSDFSDWNGGCLRFRRGAVAISLRDHQVHPWRPQGGCRSMALRRRGSRMDIAVAAAVSHVRNAADSEVGIVTTRSRNLGTAVILLSIALAFFVGVIAKYWLLSAG